MTEQLIGVDFAACVRFIAEHNFPLDRIAKIACGRDCLTLTTMRDCLTEEASPLFCKIAEQLRTQGKLVFPGERVGAKSLFCGFGCWTTNDDFLISTDLYSSAFDDFNALSREEKIKTTRVIEEEPSYLVNTIYEFDRAAIQAIRTKYKPGIRKAIAQFFGG